MKVLPKYFFNRPFLITLFAAIEILILFYFINDYRRHDSLYRAHLIQSFDANYQGAVLGYDHTTRMIFNDIVNKPQTLKLIASALDDKKNRELYRKELYRLMLPSHEKQKAVGIRQFHFHLKDGTSLLRMHSPLKHGDNLFRRHAVYRVNTEKKPVTGYEVGHFADGYRYMYPLFLDGRHIGSVEFCITSKGIIDHMKQVSPADYYFMVDRSVLDNITYEDWKNMNFKKSQLSDSFMTGQTSPDNAAIASINSRLKDKVSDRLSRMESFAEKERINGKDYLIAFLPISDLKGRPTAYFIKYIIDDYSGHHYRVAMVDICLFTLLLAAMFYFIENAQSDRKFIENKNAELEQMTISLQKSENFLQTIIETEPECVKLLDEKGGLLQMNRSGLNMIDADSLDQVKGQCVYPLVKPEYREAFKSLTENIFKGKTGSLEFEAIGLKGKHIWLDTHAVPLRNDKGEITALLAITRDVTERKMNEERLKESELRLKESQQVAKIGSWSWDIVNNTLDWSDETFRRFDKDPAAFTTSVDYFVERIHPDDRETIQKTIRNTLKNDSPYFIQPRIINETGREWVLEGFGRVERDGAGNPLRFAGTAQDITERKKIENALHESEKKYRELVETANSVILAWDTKGNITFLNDYTEKFFGFSKEELLGRNVVGTIVPHTESSGRDLEWLMEEIRNAPDRFKDNENENITKDGRRVWLRWANKAVFDKQGALIGVLSIGNDITEHKKADEQVQQSLREKETLLRELYHRTKNNMQVITSLLNLQSKDISDKKTLQIFEDTKNRIHSMALVHEKLYKTKNLSEVNLSDYIKDLAGALVKSHDDIKNRISLHIDVAKIPVSIDTITPLGLVINEIITNALKYAFPDNREGLITIKGRLTEDGSIELSFNDNGIGMPKNINLRKTDSLGLTIIRSLVVSQIKGKLEMLTQNGTTFVLRFKDREYPARI